MTRTRPWILVAATLVLCGAVFHVTMAQATVILTQPHETLEIELHSIRDKVTLYMGDPQELLRLDCRPKHVNPRVQYAHQARAKLTIEDPSLFERAPVEGRESDRQSAEQTWEARLYPSGPTTFRLTLEAGEGVLDFTDFDTAEVRITAPETRLDVEFGRPNPSQMEVFAATLQNGSIEFRKMLNARAKTMAFDADGARCRFAITGKEYEGRLQILLEGKAVELELRVSKKVGLRIEGPAEALKPFASHDLVAEGEGLVSKNYAKAKCKILLNVAQAAGKTRLDWD